jgi:REP element-mobilizing transposase RayT
METKSLNHSCYQLQYHIVWGTKYRRKWLKDYVAKELELSLKTTAKKYPGLHMITLGTDQDHMHMQVEIPPTISICDAVRYFKMNSSIHLRKNLEDLHLYTLSITHRVMLPRLKGLSLETKIYLCLSVCNTWYKWPQA